MPNLRRLLPLAWCLIGLTVASCSSWEATPLRPPVPESAGSAHEAERLPDRVRVHLVDGSMLEMAYPRVDGDSLRGMRPEGSAPHATNRRLAVSIMEVRSIDAQRSSGGKAAGLVFGVLAVCGLGFLVAAFVVAGDAAD